MIILNERDYAERVIKSCDLGKNPMSAIWHIAKYYFACGEKKAAVKKHCTELLVRNSLINGGSFERYIEMLDKTLETAKKSPLIEIKNLSITAAEIETIDRLPKATHRKLAFTLLILARYRIAVNPESDWWVRDEDSEVFKLANLTCKKESRYLILHELSKAGLIEFGNAVTNSAKRVLFANADSPVVLCITDMRNLGYQYQQFVGAARFMPCDQCKQLVPIGTRQPMRVLCKEHRDKPERNKVVECVECHMLYIKKPDARTNLCPRCFAYKQQCDHIERNRRYRDKQNQ